MSNVCRAGPIKNTQWVVLEENLRHLSERHMVLFGCISYHGLAKPLNRKPILEALIGCWVFILSLGGYGLERITHFTTYE